MKTVATIRPTRSAGMAMTILGGFILLVVVPIFLFTASNFDSGFGYLVALVPVFIGMSAVVVGLLQFNGRAKFGRVIEIDSAAAGKEQRTEDRLDELERLKRRDMITPEEYATKRQEILKDL